MHTSLKLLRAPQPRTPDRAHYNTIHCLCAQVKSQGYCASSWAFSAAGAVEGQHFKKKGQEESLSEQQLIDCSWSYGNAGCNGGHMAYSFRYIMDNEGICTESSYPYLGYVSSCRSILPISTNYDCVLYVGILFAKSLKIEYFSDHQTVF